MGHGRGNTEHGRSLPLRGRYRSAPGVLPDGIAVDDERGRPYRFFRWPLSVFVTGLRVIRRVVFGVSSAVGVGPVIDRGPVMGALGVGGSSAAGGNAAYGREPVEYVFVNVDTGVAEVADSSAYLVELGPLSDADAELLNDADSFGAYSEPQTEVVRRVGVPFSELLEAWQLVRRLRSVVQSAALLPERDYHFTVVAQRGADGVALWADTVAIWDEARTVFDHVSGDWVAAGSGDDEAGDWDIHVALAELSGALGVSTSAVVS